MAYRSCHSWSAVAGLDHVLDLRAVLGLRGGDPAGRGACQQEEQRDLHHPMAEARRQQVTNVRAGVHSAQPLLCTPE